MEEVLAPGALYINICRLGQDQVKMMYKWLDNLYQTSWSQSSATDNVWMQMNNVQWQCTFFTRTIQSSCLEPKYSNAAHLHTVRLTYHTQDIEPQIWGPTLQSSPIRKTSIHESNPALLYAMESPVTRGNQLHWSLAIQLIVFQLRRT